MKKKLIFLLIVVLMLFIPIFTVNASSTVTFDADECINEFGSITFKSSGSNNDNGGNIVFDNKKNNKTWNTDPVTFDVDVRSKSKHKVIQIGYGIVSKTGYSCTGYIVGTNVENNSGNVVVSVKIDKGWVKEMSFWGKSVKRSNGKDGDTIDSEIINVKREMTEDELKAINEDTDLEIGETFQCKSLENIIKDYWSWVIILLPIITLLLITVDFVKPIVSGDAEQLKKSSSNAIKRVTALMIFLMLPLFVNLVFNLFGIETCMNLFY